MLHPVYEIQSSSSINCDQYMKNVYVYINIPHVLSLILELYSKINGIMYTCKFDHIFNRFLEF